MPMFYTKKKVGLFYEVLNPQEEKTVAFFNGVMASTLSWDSQSTLFARMGYRVILHDFKGQLLSEKPQGPYTFKEHAKEALELFEFLNVQKVHLVGTSYGGEVAMRFALDYPKHTKTLSVIDSVSQLDEVLKFFLMQWKELALQEDPERFFWSMLPSIYGNSFIQNNLDLLKERAKMLQLANKDYFKGQVALYDTFLNDLNMTKELPTIKNPVLIVCGQEDILKPVKFSKIMAKAIPHAEWIEIPDCGHVTILEKPHTLNSMLLGFIAKHQ